MFNVKEMLGSKKFKVAVFSVLAVVCSILADKVTVSQGLEGIVMIVMAYLGAQGIADIGKETSKNAGKDKPDPGTGSA